VGYSRTQLVSNAGEVRGWLVLYQDLTELATLREKAERAERLAVLGQLAAGLAHEIRNPLGAISGSVELVRDADVLGAEDKRLLGTVLGEVDRVNELVSTMLELGRPTTPERRVVDVADIAHAVVELARRQASTVTLLLESSPAMASVDPGQMRQVLWNLVKNAIQFSPKYGEVLVRARSEEGRMRLEVEDHGRGIDAADVGRVFDPFFTKRAHGVGLGLAIAKQIVDAHGGTLTVESAPGRTCFVVSIASAPTD
jgi:signal transduction histidine kinase